MYVILSSKPGEFTTEINGDLRPVEAYDYLFYGHRKAHFVIAELLADGTKVRVVEEATKIVNTVPTKFLPKFETVEKAYDELKHLTTFGQMGTVLNKVDAG